MEEKLLEKGILLTYDEVRILLGGLGIHEIEGLYMPEKDFHEEEILSALHHLSKAGFITAGVAKFSLRKDVREILSVVAFPDDTRIWEPFGAEGPSYFLYFAGSQVVISEQYFQKKDTIRYTLADLNELEEIRKEGKDDYSGSRSSDSGEKV